MELKKNEKIVLFVFVVEKKLGEKKKKKDPKMQLIVHQVLFSSPYARTPVGRHGFPRIFSVQISKNCVM